MKEDYKVSLIIANIWIACSFIIENKIISILTLIFGIVWLSLAIMYYKKND